MSPTSTGTSRGSDLFFILATLELGSDRGEEFANKARPILPADYHRPMDLPVGEPLETHVDEPDGSLDALGSAASPEEIATVAAKWPECLAAWAALGEEALGAGRPVEAYAYFRVGYHRGLDRIRRHGWKGQGRVPWAHEPNRGFLRAVGGLGRAAAAIGETHEAERCSEFLDQLAPDAPS